jgi:hypothetical protein
MKKIICTAGAWGYGPVSKLLTICSLLEDYSLHFFGSDVALELARHEAYFSGITQCDFIGERDRKRFKRELAKTDLVLNVLKPDIFDLVPAGEIPCVFVDSLFWMWDKIMMSGVLSQCKDVEKYIVQQFPGVEQRTESHRDLVDTFAIVNPIVDRSQLQQTERENIVLINLSGLENPYSKFGDTLKYHEPIGQCIARAAAKTKWQKIMVAGNFKVMAYLDQRYGNDRLSFRHLSHSMFLSLLNKIALLVTSPGLTATYEAFVYGVPIRFLPAQNHSQALMQRKYIENGFADIPMAWSCFYPQCVITDDMPQELGVKMVMDAIETFSRDSEAQEKADDILTEMLTREPPGTHHQKKCFGMDINGDGASQVKAIIAGILS